jgi:hypothetical protein
MKKILLVLSIIAASSITCLAQKEADSTNTTESANVKKGKSKIRIEELPEGVKQALEDQAFKGWMINAAFRDARNEQYEVELKNGVDRQIVKFDKEGKRLGK